MRYNIRSGLWYALHRWFGLPVWLLLLFVCVTGTLACVSHEILWLVDPETRAPNPEQQAHVSYGAMLTAIEDSWPRADPLFIADDAPYLATRVIAALPGAPAATIYVNQYSGAIQGINRGPTFPDFMRSLHGWLLIPWDEGTSWGYYLVGLLGLLLLGSLVTALVLDKNFWHSFYRPRLRTGSPRLFWSDLHRVIGVWLIPFIAIIGATGLWYLTQGALWDAQTLIQPPAPMLERQELPELAQGAPEAVGIETAVAAARGAIEDMNIEWISLPETAYHTVEVYGQSGFPLVSDFAVAAYINPYNGAVAGVRDLAGLGPLQWIDHIADPLHYGNFGGLWSKAIWFVFGSALSALILTGMLVWLRRTARQSRRASQGAAARPAAAGADR